jgi:hypothetical protein
MRKHYVFWSLYTLISIAMLAIWLAGVWIAFGPKAFGLFMAANAIFASWAMFHVKRANEEFSDWLNTLTTVEDRNAELAACNFDERR